VIFAPAPESVSRLRPAGWVPYDPTIYRGSAAHHRYGRPPYSPELEVVLTEEVGLDGICRLLGGDCGPGMLTVRLAPLFDEAIGLDPALRLRPGWSSQIYFWQFFSCNVLHLGVSLTLR
jgi:hypothetical protein